MAPIRTKEMSQKPQLKDLQEFYKVEKVGFWGEEIEER